MHMERVQSLLFSMREKSKGQKQIKANILCKSWRTKTFAKRTFRIVTGSNFARQNSKSSSYHCSFTSFLQCLSFSAFPYFYVFMYCTTTLVFFVQGQQVVMLPTKTMQLHQVTANALQYFVCCADKTLQSTRIIDQKLFFLLSQDFWQQRKNS